MKGNASGVLNYFYNNSYSNRTDLQQEGLKRKHLSTKMGVFAEQNILD